MTELWGKRWHQLFQHLFVVYGSRPGRKFESWYFDHGRLHRFGHHARHRTVGPRARHKVHPHGWILHPDGRRLYLGAEVEAVDGQGLGLTKVREA
jgi:hypothetical protein